MGLFSAGMQSLLDGQQEYLRSGLTTFLRVQNFPPQGDFQEFGVSFAPTGADLGESGFTDLEIIPSPEVRDVSLHNIAESAGTLKFGARTFIVSNTFVEKVLEQYPKIKDPEDVWRNWDATYVDNNPTNQSASVVGIIYQNRLHSIEDIHTVQIGGQTIRWKLTCNRLDVPLVGLAEEGEEG